MVYCILYSNAPWADGWSYFVTSNTV